MSNPVQRASKVGRNSRKLLAGFDVIIRRRDNDGEILWEVKTKATVGETRTEDLTQTVVTTSRIRDFFVDRNDYCDGHGQPVAPCIDDEIDQVVGGVVATFQVLPETDEREYRRSDRAGHWWRIHTKEIHNEDVKKVVS